MNLPRRLEPGDEVHYVALLDQEGNTLTTMPMREPLVAPFDASADTCRVEVSLHVYTTFKGEAK